MDKKDLTTFQEILLNYFEEEVMARLEEKGTKIHSEEDVMSVVNETYAEMEEIMEAISVGSVDIAGLSPAENERYH